MTLVWPISQVWAALRRRPGPLAGTFVALTVAALLVTVTACLIGTGLGAPVPPQRLAAATVVITGDQSVRFTYGHGDQAETESVALPSYRRLPASLAGEMSGLPGVRQAVADVSFPVTLDSGAHPAAAMGHGWQSAALTPFSLTSGHPPSAGHDVVIGAGLARSAGWRIGDTVRLTGRNGPPYTIVGLASAPSDNRASNQAAFFTDSQAAQLYGHPGQADLIGVVGAPGTPASVLAAAVRSRAGSDFTVLTGAARGQAEDLTVTTDKTNLRALGTGAGIDVAAIALFVVAGTVALSVGQRRRQFALLRAVGATPGQIRRTLIGELFVLGGLAGLVAYLPGTWLASLSVRGMVSHHLLPVGIHAWTGPVVLPIAAGAAILVGELAGLVSGRRAARINPAEALREASVERRWPHPVRVGLGLASLGGGVALCVLTLTSAGSADQQLSLALLLLLAFLVAVALLGPLLVGAFELLIRLPAHALSPVGARLALADARVRPRRMASAVVTVALAVAFVGAVYLTDAGVAHASVGQGRQRLLADQVITAPDPGLVASALPTIASQPGVAQAVGLIPTTVVVPDQGNEQAVAEGVTPGPLNAVLDLQVTAGSLDRFGIGDIAISRQVAGSGEMGVHVGQTVTTYLADGTVYRARVSAIYFRSLGFADVLVAANAGGGGHLGPSGIGQVLIRDAGTARTAVDLASLAGRYPGLTVASRDVVNARYQRQTDQNSYANDLVLATIALLAAIALLNTLVMTTIGRRDTLGLLRQVGATTGQLLSMATWQAMMVSAVGLVLGAGAGAVTLAAITKALTGSWTPYIPWFPSIGIIAAVIGLAAAGSLGPTAALIGRESKE